MVEIILALLAIGILLAVPILVVGLLIVALVRTARIGELSARLDRLERELRQLQRPAPEAEVEQTQPPTVLPVEPAARPSRPWQPRVDAAHLETWIGRQALGWVAVVLLLFAVAFFLKYAFDNAWIGELGRVAIGILAGAALCVAGLDFHRRGWRLFSQMLTGGGVAVLYLTTFGAFGYYHLLPQREAAVFLVVLVVETAALALLYDAAAIALMAVVGGLLSPVLLHTGVDQYPSLFTYLALLNAGALGLTVLRAWPAIATVALVGTQALFWAWYNEHYHPAKLGPAVLFQGVVFGLFLAHTVAAHLWRRRPAGLEDLARLLLNAFFFTLALYGLLDEDYHVWMGTLVLVLAIVYAALGWLLLSRRPDDVRLVFTVTAAALALIAVVFPLQTEAAWIALGWAVEGVALWWFGLRARLVGLRGFGVVLLVLASTHLILVDTPTAHSEPFVPLFNTYGLPAVGVAACVLLAALAARRFLDQLDPLDRMVRAATGLAGVLLLWLVLTVETYQFFSVQIDRSLAEAGTYGTEWVDAQGRPIQDARVEEAQHLRRVAQTALSIVWAAYAALVLAAGFLLHNVPLRGVALALFGLTLAKVIVIDMERLPGLYRVAAFFVLAVLMGAAAWGYQKLKPRREAPEGEEVAAHERE